LRIKYNNLNKDINSLFFLKKYDNLNFLILKKSRNFYNYGLLFKKDNSLVYDDSINIDGNPVSKEKNLSDIMHFKPKGFKRKFLKFFEERGEIIKKYKFNSYDELS
jgi:hypothetical protein